jgi:hypothetical protein
MSSKSKSSARLVPRSAKFTSTAECLIKLVTVPSVRIDVGPTVATTASGYGVCSSRSLDAYSASVGMPTVKAA